jgi:hypothetical protein
MVSIWWDYVSEMKPPAGLFFIPRWYVTMWKHGGMMSTGETPDSSTRDLWQFYPKLSSSKVGVTGEVYDEFCLTKYPFILIEFFSIP